MRYYNYFEVTDAVRAFTGDFDLTALIDVLFEEVATHPEYGTLFIEREYTDAEIQACDVTSWQTCEVPTSDGASRLPPLSAAVCRRGTAAASLSPIHAIPTRGANGSRAEWESDPATVERMIRAS